MGRRPGSHLRNPLRGPVSSQVSSWLNFTPALLNPLVWLDASATSTITESGGDVSQWNDKSGNGYNVTQSVGTNQPKTGTRTLNGLNVIDFDGTDDFMASAFDITQLTSSKALTLILVGAFDVTGSGRVFITAGRGTNTWDLGSGFQFGQNASGNVTSFIGIGNGGATASDFRSLLVEAANTSPKIYALTASASPAVYGTFVNGADGANTVDGAGTMIVSDFLSASSGNHRVVLGARTSSNPTPLANFLNGYIGEVVLFDRVLTTNERSALRDHLDAKWAVY